MRLSWYADTGVAVFSIWQGGTCTGTFRLPIADLPRMVEALQRGPRGDGGRGTGEQPISRGPQRAAPRQSRAAMPDGDIETGQLTSAIPGPPNAGGPRLASGAPRDGEGYLPSEQPAAGYASDDYGAGEAGGTGYGSGHGYHTGPGHYTDPGYRGGAAMDSPGYPAGAGTGYAGPDDSTGLLGRHGGGRPGSHRDDGLPGGGFPDDGLPGTGPYESLPGSGPYESLPGTGAYESLPGSGSYEDLPGTGAHEGLPGTGPRGSLPGAGAHDSPRARRRGSGHAGGYDSHLDGYDSAPGGHQADPLAPIPPESGLPEGRYPASRRRGADHPAQRLPGLPGGPGYEDQPTARYTDAGPGGYPAASGDFPAMGSGGFPAMEDGPGYPGPPPRSYGDLPPPHGHRGGSPARPYVAPARPSSDDPFADTGGPHERRSGSEPDDPSPESFPYGPPPGGRQSRQRGRYPGRH